MKKNITNGTCTNDNISLDEDLTDNELINNFFYKDGE